MPKIFINPGHGQKNNGVFDPGAIGPSGLREADVVLNIGEHLKEKMKRNGWAAMLYQDGDLWDVSNKANAWNPDYFVSIHCNAVADRAAKGIETYCYKLGSMGEKLAKAVQAELIKATGLTGRGAKAGNLHVLRETNAPAILVEVGFISNPAEESLLKTEEFREKVAEAIAIGLFNATGVPYVSSRSEVVDVSEKSLKDRLAKDDTFLTVRVREEKAEQAIREINKLGYAAKKLDLA